MTKTIRKSVKSFGCLFVLNWDTILFFAATGAAMTGWAYLITM